MANRRGRPATVWLGLDEVAGILGVEPAWLAGVLDACPGALRCGSWAGGELRMKQSELFAALGLTAGLPWTCSVKEAAAYLGKDEDTVYRWLEKRGPDGRPLIPHWKHAGVIRLSVLGVRTVPPVLPTWAQSPFFAKTA